MSYTVEDLFSDKIEPEMVKLFQECVEEHESRYEKFMEIILRQAMDDRLRRALLNIVVDPYKEGLSVEEAVQRCLGIFSDSAELRKLEYSKDSAIISVNYRGVEEEDSHG